MAENIVTFTEEAALSECIAEMSITNVKPDGTPKSNFMMNLQGRTTEDVQKVLCGMKKLVNEAKAAEPWVETDFGDVCDISTQLAKLVVSKNVKQTPEGLKYDVNVANQHGTDKFDDISLYLQGQTTEDVQEVLCGMKYKKVVSKEEAQRILNLVEKKIKSITKIKVGIDNVVSTLDGAMVQLRYIENGKCIGDVYNITNLLRSLMVSTYSGPNSHLFGQFKIRQYFTPKSQEIFAKYYGQFGKNAIASLNFYKNCVTIDTDDRMYIESGMYCPMRSDKTTAESYILELLPGNRFAIFSNKMADDRLKGIKEYVDHIKMLCFGLKQVAAGKRPFTMDVPDEALQLLESLFIEVSQLCVSTVVFDKFGEDKFPVLSQVRRIDWSNFEYPSAFDSVDSPGCMRIYHGETLYKVQNMLKYLVTET